MRRDKTNDDPAALALAALGWILSDRRRAERLLALTGLDPEALRARLEEPALHLAVLGFLEGHEPDLVACAEALGLDPASLAAARRELEGPPPA
ncbi:MAG: DUF3572 family protein [Sphingomonadaceae bacterium]